MSRFLYLIPLLPLVGFVLNFAFGVKLMRRRLGLPGPGLGRWPDPGAHGHSGDPHAHGAEEHGAGHHAAAHDDHGHAAAHAHPPAIVGIIACGTVLLSFLLSVLAVW